MICMKKQQISSKNLKFIFITECPIYWDLYTHNNITIIIIVIL